MGLADNKFGATATVPVELLQQYWGATYTTPQTTANQVGYVNLTGKVEVDADLDDRRRRRMFARSASRLVDGNPTGDAALRRRCRRCSASTMTARRRTG